MGGCKGGGGVHTSSMCDKNSLLNVFYDINQTYVNMYGTCILIEVLPLYYSKILQINMLDDLTELG